MTLREIEDRVMARLGLTQDSQRARIRAEINDRIRRVTSSLGLGRTRRSSVTFTTTSGSSTVVASGVSLLENLYDPTVRKRPLTEVSMQWIRSRDAAGEVTGVPEVYAIKLHTDDVMTLQVWPKPLAVYNFPADVFAPGVDLEDPEDAPAFPSDYHDLITEGVLADEYGRAEKMMPMAMKHEKVFDDRTSELRLHLARTAWLSRQTTDRGASRTSGQVDRHYTIT